MTQNICETAINYIEKQHYLFVGGRVSQIAGGTIDVTGFGSACGLGDRVTLHARGAKCEGQVVQISSDYARVLIETGVSGVSIGDRVYLNGRDGFAPDMSWLGRVIAPNGKSIDGLPMLPGLTEVDINRSAIPAHARRALGARLETGFGVFNTLLPIVRRQRIGLFAGSGVGKSTLLGNLAQGVDADVVVVALVGERGREVQHFVKDVIGPEAMKKTVVVAATSDQAPQVRLRCAPSAMAVAEYFRDQGKHVLLLVDSVTRFCEAHRELAVAGGEPANLRGYPASMAPAIAALCERAGPGSDGIGDITALFSVLVAGSDMDEPVADMLRGVLDGHFILDREIAERGRFPAIDVLKSVSRSLPTAASAPENGLISQTKALLAKYENAELMIQSGLYVAGSDAEIDRAIACYGTLEAFLEIRDKRGTITHFAKLRQALGDARAAPVQSA